MTTPAMEACLNEVGKYVRPPKEKTLFPLGGRAYYENPALDLLAFFLRPDAEHGFNGLFLQAFLKCQWPQLPQQRFRRCKHD
jgi:hypothetical protein